MAATQEQLQYAANYRHGTSRNKYLKSQQKFKKKLRTKDPLKLLFWAARGRAKKFNLEFNIEISDLILPSVCPILGIPIIVGTDKRTHNSPSIDRIIPKLGYIKNNVQIISWRANDLKKNGSIDEFEKLVSYLKKEA